MRVSATIGFFVVGVVVGALAATGVHSRRGHDARCGAAPVSSSPASHEFRLSELVVARDTADDGQVSQRAGNGGMPPGMRDAPGPEMGVRHFLDTVDRLERR